MLPGCAPRQAQLEPPVRQAIQRAERELASNRLDRAQLELRRAIGLTRHKADVYLVAFALNRAAIGRSGIRATRYAADFGREILDLSDSRKLDRKLTSDEIKDLLVTYGTLSYELHQHRQAFPPLERAARLWPNDAVIANQLGYFYAEAGVKLDRALVLTRRAVRARPKEAAYVDSLGWVYYKLGRYKDALRELRRAVHLAPDQADLRFHLGATYAKVGRRAEAQIEFRKALALDPFHVAAREWLRRIRQSPSARS